MAGPRPPVIWSSEAEADLVDIWNHYVEVADIGTAENMVRAIGRACRILEEHPLAGRAREEIRPGLRSIVARQYVVFYRLHGDTAEIVRLLDGRRDIEEIFDDGSN